MVRIRKIFRIYQGLIFSVLILIGVGVGLLWGVIPTIQKLISLRSETSDLVRQTGLLRTKAGILSASDEETYKNYLSELAIAVPTDKSLTSVFSTIDGLGALTGVTLSDFTLTKPGSLATSSAAKQSVEEKQVGSNLLPFSLTVTGSYDQIHKFLAEAIHVRRFFRVRNFDIFFESGDSISVKMGMDAFYAPLPTKLGSVEQPIDPLSEQDEEVITKVVSFTVLSQQVADVESNENLSPTTSSREDPFSP